MPRAYLPNLVPQPKRPVAFKLTPSNKQKIAKTIPGTKGLSPDVIELLEWNVTCYRAVETGSSSCTVANTRFALRHLEKNNRSCQEALQLLANERAAVDYTTLNAIQKPAKAVLAKEPGAQKILLAAARIRAAELRQHPRIVTGSEPLRFFCGVLREIFKVATAHLNDPITSEEAWRLCRRFAWAVFDSSDIGRHHFFAHTDRLTEYLQTDVATD